MNNQILVLDDDPQVAKTIKTVLSRYHYEVSWARTSEDASRQLKTNRYDLVIVDYRLPGDNGITWMSTAREAGHFMPFILLSGFTMNREDQARLRNLLGVRYILEKPIDMIGFIESVSIAIKQSNEDIESLFNNRSRQKRVRKFSDTSQVAIQEVVEAVIERSKEEPPAEDEFDLASFLAEASDDLTFDTSPLEEIDSQETTGDYPAVSMGSSDVFDAELEESLMELRLEYLKDLPDLLRSLADKLEIAAATGWEQKDIMEALIQAHNIKGSSGSHSLMIVSELAAAIEHALDAMEKESKVISGGDLEAVPLAQPE